MSQIPLQLTLGPILYFWPKDTVLDFYQAARDWPVDTIYLGEMVCSRRQNLRNADWLALAQELIEADKHCVLSCQALIESESDLKRLRQLVDNGQISIEANDMGAARLAHARRLPFVAGPYLNIYNAETLALYHRLGAYRWLPPFEMSQDSLATLLKQGVAIETELFAWGKLPLALSSRCFTARYYNLKKDSCEFRCQDHPEGLQVNTRDQQAFLTLNGIQTLSAGCYSLLPYLQAIADMGVTAVRISPQPQSCQQVVSAFAHRLSPSEPHTEAPMPTEHLLVDGYWLGRAGMTPQGALDAHS